MEPDGCLDRDYPTIFVIKGVVMSPSIQSEISIFVMTPNGATLAVGTFGVDPEHYEVFTPYSEDAQEFEVLDLVILEIEDDPDFPNAEGVVLAIRKGNPKMTKAELTSRQS